MKFLILDSNSILNRAYYGIKQLSTKSGFYTNGIYGFLNTLEKLKEETKPDIISMAFDLRAKTFRHKAYDGYKANRKGMPNELAQQVDVLKELLDALGYKIIECEGYEADDILGTISKLCEENNYECVIATGDRDSLQLVSDKTCVRLTTTKFGKPEVTLYDESKVFEKYGVKPKQLIDIKAIQGDTSDNIPGVKGIGEKGAMQLIQKYGSLDYIYKNLDKLDIKESMRKKLIENKDMAYLSYDLGKIIKDAPINKDLNSYKQNPIDIKKAAKLMTKLELFSLMKKMNITAIEDKENDVLSFNVLEIKNLDFLKENKDYFIICDYSENLEIKEIAISSGNDIYKTIDKNLIEKIISSNIKIITYDCKMLYKALIKNSKPMPNVIFDAMLALYILNSSNDNYNLEQLLIENSKQIKLNSEDKLVKDLAILVAVYDDLSRQIKDKKQEFLLNEIEIKLAKILAQMELEGFEVDKSGLQTYAKELDNKALKLEEKICEEAGVKFNVNSPKQLGTVLFEKLKLPFAKKTKTGYSTNATILEKLKYDYEIVDDILNYRTLSKIKSTFCDGIIKLLGKDNRVHTNFNQTETRTGRISSTEPNLQNIPVRTDIGKNLRKFFKAKEGFVLVDADYSQIELRVLAHISEDKAMIEEFNKNEDIHKITASQIFNMPLKMVTPLMRAKAKTINFGIIYGMGAYSLSQNLKISRKEAQEYIDSYFNHYKGIENYMKEIIKQAEITKQVSTMFNRTRNLPEINSSNFQLKAFGQRVAMNTPIQGSAADIIKLAMIKVDEKLKKANLNAKIILQVHDELIVEAKEQDAKKAMQILKHEMENAVKLKVPLLVTANIGKTWFEAKG